MLPTVYNSPINKITVNEFTSSLSNLLKLLNASEKAFLLNSSAASFILSFDCL